MYALDANSITVREAVVRFRSEHLAALIKPDLINSDKERKIEGVKGELFVQYKLAAFQGTFGNETCASQRFINKNTLAKFCVSLT
ncbi:UNVERIFIED_CONTAM: hypothetical protein FKN15_007680 [Acipenser sinensis]